MTEELYDRLFLVGNIIGYVGIAGDLAQVPEALWLPVYLVGLITALSMVWRNYIIWVRAILSI